MSFTLKICQLSAPSYRGRNYSLLWLGLLFLKYELITTIELDKPPPIFVVVVVLVVVLFVLVVVVVAPTAAVTVFPQRIVSVGIERDQLLKKYGSGELLVDFQKGQLSSASIVQLCSYHFVFCLIPEKDSSMVTDGKEHLPSVNLLSSAPS